MGGVTGTGEDWGLGVVGTGWLGIVTWVLPGGFPFFGTLCGLAVLAGGGVLVGGLTGGPDGMLVGSEALLAGAGLGGLPARAGGFAGGGLFAGCAVAGALLAGGGLLKLAVGARGASFERYASCELLGFAARALLDLIGGLPFVADDGLLAVLLALPGCGGDAVSF